MTSPDDYCPVGLGRTCEDLINKHAGKLMNAESPYQWALRTARETKALLAKLAPKSVEPEPSKPPMNATGKTAYEWAMANGKSATEAAKFCGVTEYSIKAHRSYYKLPALVDGRINSGDRKRIRRDPALLDSICREAMVEMKRTGASQTSVCRKYKLDSKTFRLFTLRNRKRK